MKEADELRDECERTKGDLGELRAGNSETLKTQDEEFDSTTAEKNQTIEELMEKVKRTRTQIKDERTSFRHLEDELEEVLDKRLDKDTKIQTTSHKFKDDLKDPKYNQHYFDQLKERNELLRA